MGGRAIANFDDVATWSGAERLVQATPRILTWRARH
jgi:hypothetical protein